LSLPDPGVAAAINGLRSDGGTSFSSGLTSAISVVNQSLQNPNVLESVIVALTDGDTGSLSSITRQIAELELIGTKVFTFAIGRGSSCTETFQTLSMRTGAGNCTKVE
jgi:Mg-chelatase subunit ChlD